MIGLKLKSICIHYWNQEKKTYNDKNRLLEIISYIFMKKYISGPGPENTTDIYSGDTHTHTHTYMYV